MADLLDFLQRDLENCDFRCRARPTCSISYSGIWKIEFSAVAHGLHALFHTAGFGKLRFPLSQMANLLSFIQRDLENSDFRCREWPTCLVSYSGIWKIVISAVANGLPTHFHTAEFEKRRIPMPRSGAKQRSPTTKPHAGAKQRSPLQRSPATKHQDSSKKENNQIITTQQHLAG